VTEALLLTRLDDEEEAQLYLETKMIEFVEIILKRICHLLDLFSQIYFH
jgi:hypothetical protein